MRVVPDSLSLPGHLSGIMCRPTFVEFPLLVKWDDASKPLFDRVLSLLRF